MIESVSRRRRISPSPRVRGFAQKRRKCRHSGAPPEAASLEPMNTGDEKIRFGAAACLDWTVFMGSGLLRSAQPPE
jgi:hypothetical protein